MMSKIRFQVKKIISGLLIIAMSAGLAPNVYAEEITVIEDNTKTSVNDAAEENAPAEVIESEGIVSEEIVSEEVASEEMASEETVLEETSSEEISSDDIGIESTTESYMVYKNAPYGGEYLIMTNTNTSKSTTAESVGVLPCIETAEEYIEEYDDEDNILGYDENGVRLIDPSSVLPEPILDESYSDDYSAEEEIQAVNYTVGTTKQLKLNTAKNYYSFVTCVCVSVGNHCTVWIPTDDPIYVSNKSAMTTYVNAIRDQYESMYSKTVNAFGDMYYADYYGDNDGKVAFICYDLEGDYPANTGAYLGGYFASTDLSVYSNKSGNNMDCLHVDSYQGMSRSNNTLNTSNIYGTMMHELQHMIAWSNLRRIEVEKGRTKFSLSIPTWLNEGYSEAANHLCYGYNASRIRTYNSYVYNGSVSLTRWDSTLADYSISYLFSQYIRTLYAQNTGTNGWTIYSKAFSRVDSDKDLLSAIAEELGTTSEQLIEDYWIANFMLNNEGPYGYNGEEWAENIKQTVNSRPASSLAPGASQVISKSSYFTPSGNSRNIKFAGLSKTVTVQGLENISLLSSCVNSGYGEKTVYYSASNAPNAIFYYTTDGSTPTRDSAKIGSGGIKITKVGTTTIKLLGVADGFKDYRYTDSVTMSILSAPTISAEYDDSGNVTLSISCYDEDATIFYGVNGNNPKTNGTKYNGTAVTYPVNIFDYMEAVVRRAGYGDSLTSRYRKVTPSPVPMNMFADSAFDGGHIIKLMQKDGELLTYTLDGTTPTKSSAVMPSTGITITKLGTTVVTVKGWKSGYLPSTKSYTVNISKLNAPTISKTINESDKSYTITLKDNGPESTGVWPSEMYYSIDNGAEIQYTAAFSVDGSAPHSIKAYTKRLGDVQSDNAIESTTKVSVVELGEIVSTPIYGGYNVSVSAESDAEVRYTTNGSVPTIKSALFPAAGLKITEAGTTNLRVKAWKDGCIPSTKSANITVARLEKPSITSAWNEDDCEYDITIKNSAANLAADIFYSVDGTSYVQYEDAFKVSADKAHSIVAYATKVGSANSLNATLSIMKASSYVPKDIVATAVYGGYKLTISDSDSAVVYRYTLNGAEPTNDSSIWPANGITISSIGDTVVTVKAWKKGYLPESKKKVITVNKLVSPEINPTFIAYLNEYNVQLINKNSSNAELVYAIDDSSEEGYIAYNKIFNIAADNEHMIYAYAKKKGCVNSEVVSFKTDKVKKEYSPLSATPRVLVSSITVNKKYDAEHGTEMLIMPLENEEIYSCLLSGDKKNAFSIEHVEDDDWVVKIINPSIPTGAYKFDMLMRGTPYMEEPAKVAKITINVVDKKPVVTLKKISMNKYYANSSALLELTSKDGMVEVVDFKNDKYLGFTKNFKLVDIDSDGKMDSIAMDGGYNDFVYGSNNRPVVTGLLTVKVNGYQNQDIPITVTVATTVPKISQVVAPKYNYNLFVNNNLSAVLNYQIINGQDKYVLEDITGINIDTNLKSYEKIAGLLDQSNPVETDGSNIIVNFRKIDNMNYAGTYTVPLLVSANTKYGEMSNIPITAKFTVDKATADIKATVAASTLKLNKTIDDYVYTKVSSPYSDSTVSDVLITAFESARNNNFDEYVKLRYNGETSCLEAYYDNYYSAVSSACKTYKFNCVPVLKSSLSGEEVVASKPFIITVSMIDKAPTVTATAKGNVCVLNRDNTSITYTIKKTNMFSDFDVKNESSQAVVLESPISLANNEFDGTEYLELAGDPAAQFANNSTISVKLKDDVTIIRGKKYVIRLGFLLKDGSYLYTPNIKVTPVQSTVKIVQDKKPILYKSVNMRKRTDSLTLVTNLGEIEKVSFNDSKNNRIPAGLKYELSTDTTGKLIIRLEDSSIKAGDYTINLNVEYKGEMLETNNTKKVFPLAVKVTVK